MTGGGLITVLLIGDIFVCLFLVALVAWLFCYADDKDIDEAANLPLTEERDDG